MGRLSGFKYRVIIKKLKAFGFELFRNAAGSHEIWHNPASGRFTTIPNHPGECPKEHCGQFLNRQGLSRGNSSKN